MVAGVLVCVALFVVDARFAWKSAPCSLGLKRQTPRRWGHSPIGVLAWGLDTGLPFSTVRATALPLCGLLLVGLGLGMPWAGSAYAAGFLVGLWTACYIRAAASTPFEGADRPVTRQLIRAIPAARRLACVLLISSGVVLTLTA